MEEDKLEGIRIDIIADVYGNRGGVFTRFKRALWYGSSGRFGSHLGGGKGLRKAIRNKPEQLLKQGLLSPVKLTLAPVGAFPLVGPIIVGAINELVVTPIKLALEGFMDLAKAAYYEKVDDGSSIKGDIKNMARKILKKGPRTYDEELRKQIKQDVKDMAGAGGLLVIDRNLVKMKDAKNKIGPALNKLELMVQLSKKPFDELDDKHKEEQMVVANDVLISIVETGYYITKISRIVEVMQAALTKIGGELKALDKEVNIVDEKVQKYIIQNL